MNAILVVDDGEPRLMRLNLEDSYRVLETGEPLKNLSISTLFGRDWRICCEDGRENGDRKCGFDCR